MSPDCFFEHEDFVKYSSGGNLVVLSKVNDSPSLRALLDGLEGCLNDSEIVKHSRTTTAGVYEMAGERRIFIKRYNNRGLKYTLKYLFRKARPFRYLLNARICEINGIPVPHPVAAVAERRSVLLSRSYIVLNAVENLVPTVPFYRIMAEDPKTESSYVDALACMMAKMHSCGMVHGDAKLSNFYVSKAPHSRTYRFGTWDLDAAMIKEDPLSEHERIRDLGRTAASFAEISWRIGAGKTLEHYSAALSEAYTRSCGMPIPAARFLKEARTYL